MTNSNGGRWRLVYTGSRLVTDRASVWADLDEILAEHPRLLLRHGACRKGGDAIAEQWFRARRGQGADVIADPRPAPFAQLGPVAGPMRNSFMIGLGCDQVLAHLHAGSKTAGASGTARFAEWAGIPVTRRTIT